MASIHFFAEQIKFTLKHKRHISLWVQHTIYKEKKVPGEINYIFCSDAYLLNINTTYLKHKTLTDIITFPTEPTGHTTSKTSDKQSSINGEIYISIERVKENAKKFHTTFGNELNRVMIHGVLHLCGYGDKSVREEKKMRELEDYYLRLPVK